MRATGSKTNLIFEALLHNTASHNKLHVFIHWFWSSRSKTVRKDRITNEIGNSPSSESADWTLIRM
jgi:hypothetical protein